MAGWSDVMRTGRSALNQKFLNDIYFYVFIVIGSFFMIKLNVAAICLNFNKTLGDQDKQFVFIKSKKVQKT